MVKDLAAVLTAHGVRPTKQRLAVYTYLLEHRTHPNADSIYQALVAKDSRFSRTTVYNSLHILAQAGLIRELLLTSEEQHFDGGMEHHGHFYCTVCGAVVDVPFDTDAWQPPSPTDCRITRTEVVQYGLCSKCQSKNI